MKRRIDIRGVMIPNDYKFFYDYFKMDSTCPNDVKKVLNTMQLGDEIEVYINSGGGVIDVGSEIYTMLRSCENVKIYITGEACSAASIVAMAGYCEMSPTALMMVHCVSTGARGNHSAMEHTAEVLRTADRALCTAYTTKSGMSEDEALSMMEHETWLTAEQAKEKKLIDAIMFEEKEEKSFMVAGNFELPNEEMLGRIRQIMGQTEEPKQGDSVFFVTTKTKFFENEGRNKMNKKQYEAMRKALMDEAQNLLNNGDAEGAEKKMDEVKDLDNKWDAIAQAQADFNALNNEPLAMNPFGQMGSMMNFTGEIEEQENIYDSTEYRNAFMNYVLSGKEIPEKFKNEAGPTKTTDIGSVISPVVVQRIIEKMESIGMILPLVTKTAYPAGATIPTSTVKPVATWVAEGATSEKQKKTTGQIDIKGYKLRCAISMTLETSVMSLQVFENVFVNSVSEAMVKAQEMAFISGTGTGQPKGVLKETVETGQNVDIAATGDVTYQTLVDAEAALPLAYENGAVWNMTKKTFMKFIGMLDTNKQPIARVNYGINGKPERTLLGRRVVLNEYMTSLGSTISGDTVVAFLFDWSDYMFNTNYAMRVKTYEDDNTEDQITKAVMICDGKVIDKHSLVTVTKKKV
ncbi:phage major capsid protein [Faecalimonas sp. LCP19S3_D12]